MLGIEFAGDRISWLEEFLNVGALSLLEEIECWSLDLSEEA